VGVSCDSNYSHKAWAETPRNKGGIAGLQVPLVGDFTKTIARDYGVLFEANGISLRGTFIVNPEGTVVSESVNFFPVGRNVEEALRTIDAFQEAGKGQVCPVGWSKGKESINPKEAGRYFEKVK
jgi:peroxiredoxin (alkyl hydroperoxide reductase subunit C)